MKVQKLIASSPRLLVEDSAYFDKPKKPLAGKKRPLVVKAKGDSENPSHKKERSAENTVEKVPFSSSCRQSAGSAPAPSIISTDQNSARTPCFNQPQPQGHQWLMPVMSPSEGLVYKPCPAPGFVSQGCGNYGPPGSNPTMGNFLTPVYGPQYPFPSFPPYGPHGYFPHYGMPIMISGSSTEQMHLPARESMSTAPTQRNVAVADGLNRRAAEEIEVQGSSASSPSKRQPGSRVSKRVEGRNMLPLFPTSSPATDASKTSPRVRSPRVIKVVPHNGISASESAARIFQSIQEERKQYDSV